MQRNRLVHILTLTWRHKLVYFRLVDDPLQSQESTLVTFYSIPSITSSGCLLLQQLIQVASSCKLVCTSPFGRQIERGAVVCSRLNLRPGGLVGAIGDSSPELFCLLCVCVWMLSSRDPHVVSHARRGTIEHTASKCVCVMSVSCIYAEMDGF